jgi:hypothetical protein
MVQRDRIGLTSRPSLRRAGIMVAMTAAMVTVPPLLGAAGPREAITVATIALDLGQLTKADFGDWDDAAR